MESIVEPGEYTGTVDFGNAQWWNMGAYQNVDKVTFTFTVTKAQLRSAKADKDVYACTGDAVTPVFTAYNEGDLEGLSIEIDPAVTGVSYFELATDSKTGKPVECTDSCTVDSWHIDVNADNKPDYELASTTPLKASDLDEEGYYVAEPTAPADDAHFASQVYSVPFQVSEYATFSDVDAGSWYADAVYNANELNYMKGIAGTNLFMPLADISRARDGRGRRRCAGRLQGRRPGLRLGPHRHGLGRRERRVRPEHRRAVGQPEHPARRGGRHRRPLPARGVSLRGAAAC